ncbi:hypothetical protein [Mycobacterium colombiense]|uniref:hypothetical protein n=1 Tax=Mycobacterium colombiense TaxID=339268 RepID=UPI00111590AF|nr:hypothetical protein [Mycobacterium colombiense]
MTDDKRRSEFAKYLDDHPNEAAKLQTSIQNMLGQYKVAEGAFDSVQEQLRKTLEPLRNALMPVKLSIPVDALTQFRESMAAVFPANWPRPVPDLQRIEEVLETDGIPIVHIPRAGIVQAIVDADDYAARIQIIEERADDIAEDCKLALNRDFDGLLGEHIPLLLRAVETYQAGYHEAAQSLAVAICDTYLKKLFKNDKYKDMAQKMAIEESNEVSVFHAFNFHYALAPAVRFLDPWWPGDEGPPPSKLSRHLSTHNASTDYMTNRYAVIAIMLATSMSIAIDVAAKRRRKSD